MNVQLLRLHPNAVIPNRGTDGSAGYDLYSVADVDVYPGTIEIIPTGVAMQIPPQYVGIIKDRSSVAMQGLLTCAGVIDSDYRGEVRVVVHNTAKQRISVRTGQRFAQMLFLPSTAPHLSEGSVDETSRGENGFGSTG